MKIKNTFLIMSIMVAAAAANFQNAQACTGITLTTTSGAIVPARTIEWAGGDIGSLYQIVPRGYVQRSLVPGGGVGAYMVVAECLGDGWSLIEV